MRFGIDHQVDHTGALHQELPLRRQTRNPFRLRAVHPQSFLPGLGIDARVRSMNFGETAGGDGVK